MYISFSDVVYEHSIHLKSTVNVGPGQRSLVDRGKKPAMFTNNVINELVGTHSAINSLSMMLPTVLVSEEITLTLLFYGKEESGHERARSDPRLHLSDFPAILPARDSGRVSPAVISPTTSLAPSTTTIYNIRRLPPLFRSIHKMPLPEQIKPSISYAVQFLMSSLVTQDTSGSYSYLPTPVLKNPPEIQTMTSLLNHAPSSPQQSSHTGSCATSHASDWYWIHHERLQPPYVIALARTLNCC